MEKIRPYLKKGDHEEVSAQQAVKNILKLLNFDPTLVGVFDIWDNEVQGLVKNCEAVGLQGNRLVVKVPSTVHRQELLSMKERLIKKMNQAMGKKVINDIYFELNTDNGGTQAWQKA